MAPQLVVAAGLVARVRWARGITSYRVRAGGRLLSRASLDIRDLETPNTWATSVRVAPKRSRASAWSWSNFRSFAVLPRVDSRSSALQCGQRTSDITSGRCRCVRRGVGGLVSRVRNVGTGGCRGLAPVGRWGFLSFFYYLSF